MANHVKFDVLVTGSSGHLGTALMLMLPTLGFTPLGIDILPSDTTNRTGSIADRGFLADIFQSNPSIKHIVHTATLHKPHVDSHSQQEFIDTNITGTLALLEVAKSISNLQSFVFISTTSAFGDALRPATGHPAVWIEESVTPQPKNIYGVTKLAAEDLCYLAHKQSHLPVLVLRTSRFFPEEDDDPSRRTSLSDENLKVIELTNRRCDIEDIVTACYCAMVKAPEIRWGKYIISAPTPFTNGAQLAMLNQDSQQVFAEIAPNVDAVFRQRGWSYLEKIDRVYDSSKARRELGWQPKYTFARAVEQIAAGKEWRSALTIQVGAKGYHAISTGVYTKR